jgi:hypothetical protein
VKVARQKGYVQETLKLVFRLITMSNSVSIIPRMMYLFFSTLLVFAIAIVNTINPFVADKALAASSSNFQAGNIISDGVFFNGNGISVIEIQNFLNSKVPNCLLGVNGRKIPGTADPDYPSGRVIYASNCLKDYRETIPTLTGDQFCSPISGGNFSSAELLQKIGSACKINPKVLIVLLEKEQSLITDAYPSTIQYGSATGFNCPDTAPCNTASAGFFKQVYSAARQFQAYGTGSFTWYPVGATSAVRFHPNAACGTSPVLIQNRATAALYYYTPYQPNASALNNLYGTGDSCASYGNRNFWRIFTDWFGATTYNTEVIPFIKALYVDFLDRLPSTNEIDGWGVSLSSGQKPTQISMGFVNSDEYRLIRIRAAYISILGREGEPAGVSNWLQAMKSGLIQTDDIERNFLASKEYYLNTGGTDESFIGALYTRLIGREATLNEIAGWAGELRSSNRSKIISGIWFAPETAKNRISLMYQKYLNRTPGDSETTGWLGYSLANGEAATRSVLTGSSEYWQRAKARFP